MRISIEIDDSLIMKAKKLTGINDESILIEDALRLFIAIESQKTIMDLYGKIEIDEEAFK